LKDPGLPTDPDQRTRPDGKSGVRKLERRSVKRIAGERLNAYADKLNTNARRMKKFLKAPR
jgi:hypothetical protein